MPGYIFIITFITVNSTCYQYSIFLRPFCVNLMYRFYVFPNYASISRLDKAASFELLRRGTRLQRINKRKCWSQVAYFCCTFGSCQRFKTAECTVDINEEYIIVTFNDVNSYCICDGTKKLRKSKAKAKVLFIKLYTCNRWHNLSFTSDQLLKRTTRSNFNTFYLGILLAIW
jgi:hypothetical protein